MSQPTLKKLLFIFIFACVPTFAQSIWEVNEAASKINFTIGGPLGTKVNGHFATPKSEIKFDPSALTTSSFNIALLVSSLDTDNDKRDKHLKGEDFFNEPKYNYIHFSSSGIEKTANGYLVSGTLKIKDINKSIKIPFIFTAEGNKAIFKGAFLINRLDYGVGTSSFLVGDEVKINIEVSVMK